MRGEPSFFTIRGRHRWGLSLHLCIDTTQYSALLLACGLVDITKYTTGATSVSCPLDSWRDFLERYGVADGSKGHCEVTKGRIFYSALEDRERRTQRKCDKMPLIRIGKYRTKGETVKATLQINDQRDPPSFNYTHRSAQRKLFYDIKDGFSKYLFHDRVGDVEKWVEMTDVYNPIKDSDSDSDDSGSDDDEDDDDDESSCGTEMDVDMKNNKKPSAVASKNVTPSPQKKTTIDLRKLLK